MSQKPFVLLGLLLAETWFLRLVTGFHGSSLLSHDTVSTRRSFASVASTIGAQSSSKIQIMTNQKNNRDNIGRILSFTELSMTQPTLKKIHAKSPSLGVPLSRSSTTTEITANSLLQQSSPSSKMTNAQVAAWCLSRQLLLVLQQEEKSLTEDIEIFGGLSHDADCQLQIYQRRKKMEQMIRWLNTRLLFGGTALEYVQQAAENPKTSSNLKKDQAELQLMLDFSEFDDLAFFRDDDDEDYRSLGDDDLEDDAEELDTDSDYATGNKDHQDDTNEELRRKELRNEVLTPASSMYNFGRPLKIVSSDVPPIRSPSVTRINNDSDAGASDSHVNTNNLSASEDESNEIAGILTSKEYIERGNEVVESSISINEEETDAVQNLDDRQDEKDVESVVLTSGIIDNMVEKSRKTAPAPTRSNGNEEIGLSSVEDESNEITETIVSTKYIEKDNGMKESTMDNIEEETDAVQDLDNRQDEKDAIREAMGEKSITRAPVPTQSNGGKLIKSLTTLRPGNEEVNRIAQAINDSQTTDDELCSDSGDDFLEASTLNVADDQVKEGGKHQFNLSARMDTPTKLEEMNAQRQEAGSVDTLDRSKEQTRLYKASAAIAHSFQTIEFQPPIYTRNGHIQTILSFFSRQKNPALIEFEWDERQRMETPDGDFFIVDWKYSDQHNTIGRPSTEVPLVLLCHGLQSNSDSPLAKDMARAFNSVGMDVACLNFRGCSEEINNGPLGYHLSFTDDLKFMIKHLTKTRKESKLYLSGFSLGANVVTKVLGEWGTDAFTKYNIRGAAVNACPFDFLKVGPNFSDEGITRTLYGDELLQSLRDSVLENFEDQNYSFSKDELLECKTLREFDDLVVCDVYGFDGVDDYHRKSSVGSLLTGVAVPELIVQALDDPFFQGDTKPINNVSQPLRVQYTDHGGHCGYFQQEEMDCEATWMPRQLAKFLKHVDEQQSLLHDLYGVESRGSDVTVETGGIPERDDQKERQQATVICRSFKVQDFFPASFALNCHVQTVMGALYRKETMFASSYLPGFISGISKTTADTFRWERRERVKTPDGDFFDVDWKTSGVDFESKDTPLVVICHGLQASSDSPLVKDMTEAFLNNGMGAACINFRGCSGTVNLSPRGYHLGFTEDLQQFVLHVNSNYPDKRIYLSGFSLGANVVTKFLADLGDKAYMYNIAGAAVNALPFEVSKSTNNLNKDGLTKSLYADRILESMYERVEEMYDSGVHFPFSREKIRDCKTIMDMENLVIAPFFDFVDAWDYYDKTSTLPILDQVAVPEFVIQALDDPFLLGQSHVRNKDDRPLRLHYTKYGGHCGHVFHAPDQAYETSWMPTELARFLAHVDLCLKADVSITGSTATTSAGQRNRSTEKEMFRLDE